jgi:hypothetical protein
MRAGTVVLLLAAGFCGTSSSATGQASTFQNLFHLAGIPGVRGEARVDMIPNANELVFQTRKVKYEVPYTRIRQVILLHSDRRYEGRTYLAAVVTPYAVGSLFILKKHHMDTAVLDYVNERGGKMGIVLQMETAQGDQFKQLLTSKGIVVSEPEGDSAADPGSKPESGAANASKP